MSRASPSARSWASRSMSARGEEVTVIRPAPTAWPTRRTNRARKGPAPRGRRRLDAAGRGRGRSDRAMARGPGRLRIGRPSSGRRRAWRALLLRGVVEDGLRRSWSIPCRVRSTSVRTSRWTAVVVHRPTTTTTAASGAASPGRGRCALRGRANRSRRDRPDRQGRLPRRVGWLRRRTVDDLIGDDSGQGGPFLATAKAAEEVVPAPESVVGRHQVGRWRVAEGLGQFEDAIVARRDAMAEVLVGVEGEVGQQGAGLPVWVGWPGPGPPSTCRRRAGPVTGDNCPRDCGSPGGLGPGVDGPVAVGPGCCKTAASASGSKSAARTASGSSRSRVVSRPDRRPQPRRPAARRTVSASTRSTPGSPASTMARSTVAAGEQGRAPRRTRRWWCPEAASPRIPTGDGAGPGRARPAQGGHAVTHHVAVPRGDRTTVELALVDSLDQAQHLVRSLEADGEEQPAGLGQQTVGLGPGLDDHRAGGHPAGCRLPGRWRRGRRRSAGRTLPPSARSVVMANERSAPSAGEVPAGSTWLSRSGSPGASGARSDGAVEQGGGGERPSRHRRRKVGPHQLEVRGVQNGAGSQRAGGHDVAGARGRGRRGRRPGSRRAGRRSPAGHRGRPAG